MTVVFSPMTLGGASVMPTSSVSSPRIMSQSVADLHISAALMFCVNASVRNVRTPGMKYMGIPVISGISARTAACLSSSFPAGARMCGMSLRPLSLPIIPERATAVMSFSERRFRARSSFIPSLTVSRSGVPSRLSLAPTRVFIRSLIVLSLTREILVFVVPPSMVMIILSPLRSVTLVFPRAGGVSP